MEERQNLYDMAHRYRKNCRICGEAVAHGESFYTDGNTTVHMCCFFEHQNQEVNSHVKTV